VCGGDCTLRMDWETTRASVTFAEKIKRRDIFGFERRQCALPECEIKMESVPNGTYLGAPRD